MADADFVTGSTGLIAIDKVANQVLLLDRAGMGDEAMRLF